VVFDVEMKIFQFSYAGLDSKPEPKAALHTRKHTFVNTCICLYVNMPRDLFYVLIRYLIHLAGKVVTNWD
jgi:hypothetical protein